MSLIPTPLYCNALVAPTSAILINTLNVKTDFEITLLLLFVYMAATRDPYCWQSWHHKIFIFWEYVFPLLSLESPYHVNMLRNCSHIESGIYCPVLLSLLHHKVEKYSVQNIVLCIVSLDSVII